VVRDAWPRWVTGPGNCRAGSLQWYQDRPIWRVREV